LEGKILGTNGEEAAKYPLLDAMAPYRLAEYLEAAVVITWLSPKPASIVFSMRRFWSERLQHCPQSVC
jgi:hypothetical protein